MRCQTKEMESDRDKPDELIKTKNEITSLKKAEIKLSECCNVLKNRLDAASIQEKRDILEVLESKVTATTETINIEGIIPLETIPSDSDSVELTHHCMNMGMTTWV